MSYEASIVSSASMGVRGNFLIGTFLRRAKFQNDSVETIKSADNQSKPATSFNYLTYYEFYKVILALSFSLLKTEMIQLNSTDYSFIE